jgi:hypothetical protein
MLIHVRYKQSYQDHLERLLFQSSDQGVIVHQHARSRSRSRDADPIMPLGMIHLDKWRNLVVSGRAATASQDITGRHEPAYGSQNYPQVPDWITQPMLYRRWLFTRAVLLEGVHGGDIDRAEDDS